MSNSPQRPIRVWVRDVIRDFASGVNATFNSLTVTWIENQHVRDVVDTASGSGTLGLDLSSSNQFKRTLTGDATFEFNNPSSDPAGNSFTLVIEQDGSGGHSVTWPGSVEWHNGTSPNLDTSANTKHVFSFFTVDGGSTWIGIGVARRVA